MCVCYILRYCEVIKGFLEPFERVFVFGHVKGRQVWFAIFFRNNVVQKFKGSTGYVIAYQKSVPVGSVIVDVPFAG